MLSSCRLLGKCPFLCLGVSLASNTLCLSRRCCSMEISLVNVRRQPASAHVTISTPALNAVPLRSVDVSRSFSFSALFLPLWRRVGTGEQESESINESDDETSFFFFFFFFAAFVLLFTGDSAFLLDVADDAEASLLLLPADAELLKFDQWN